MTPPKATPVEDHPIARLFFAINHYVSTGDHIGVGIATPIDEHTLAFTIPVRVDLPQDQEDFNCLRSRVNELEGKYKLTWRYLGKDSRPGGNMEAWALVVKKVAVEDLARDLREHPGPLGWGSQKEVIDAHTWANSEPWKPWRRW